MKHLYLIFSLIFCRSLLASEDLIQVPDQCLQNLQSPCLVQSKRRSVYKWRENLIQMSSGAILQIELRHQIINHQNIQLTNFKVLNGAIAFQSSKSYEIFGFKIENDQIQYVKSTSDQKIQILDLMTMDFKILADEFDHIKKIKNSFVLQKTELLDRRSLVSYLSDFYDSKNEFKKKLDQISLKYKHRQDEDLARQSNILQKHAKRQIASVEDATRSENENLAKQALDRKRSRELFFMRTFKQ